MTKLNFSFGFITKLFGMSMAIALSAAYSAVIVIS